MCLDDPIVACPQYKIQSICTDEIQGCGSFDSYCKTDVATYFHSGKKTEVCSDYEFSCE